ncbi:unnamed protein product [Prorocentrum cordatum]|uniref:Uncharacterized protein n=1 Tax=Prorocentrum cordatum TaxID=2364126 RepID=A0ABN9V1C9_9DINO|nr:unnamed protein product [Polarella glacialis]
MSELKAVLFATPNCAFVLCPSCDGNRGERSSVLRRRRQSFAYTVTWLAVHFSIFCALLLYASPCARRAQVRPWYSCSCPKRPACKQGNEPTRTMRRVLGADIRRHLFLAALIRRRVSCRFESNAC